MKIRQCGFRLRRIIDFAQFGMKIQILLAVVVEKLHVQLQWPQILSRFSPFRKESANVNVRVTLIGSIGSNHAKIMQESVNALLVSFTKFDEP